MPAIVEVCDVSLYVMTSEFGAPTQLEKIDMLDFADLIALNKMEKKGAEDALRNVRKQFRRNRNLFDGPDDRAPRLRHHRQHSSTTPAPTSSTGRSSTRSTKKRGSAGSRSCRSVPARAAGTRSSPPSRPATSARSPAPPATTARQCRAGAGRPPAFPAQRGPGPCCARPAAAEPRRSRRRAIADDAGRNSPRRP